ncbi:MAG: ribonuclease P protein subunit [Nitrosopumilaceae archaeon]|nr:ribonuclease P protein subunit [Nitrosopumilaceae archaeon]
MTVTPTPVLDAKHAAPRAATSAEDVRFREIVGLDVRVLEAPNRSLVGLSGRIQYETKSMIEITEGGNLLAHAEDRAGHRTPHHKEGALRRDTSKGIPKRGAVLEFSRNGARIGTASGDAMLKRPFERAAA